MAGIKDLTGTKFNKLTAISQNGRSLKYEVLWKCKCDCGNEITVSASNLKTGNTKSCGCITHRIDLIGQKFNKLTVVSLYVDSNNKYKTTSAIWVCRCECGNLVNVVGYNLRDSVTKSCGCLNKELKTIHGMFDTPEYKIWQGMIQRCCNSNDRSYYNYGGRGINVCERWLKSFENFYTDMGPRPSLRHSIDRFPDKNGNYEPANCRWATMVEQANNKRNNVLCIYNGKEYTASQLAREYDININTFYSRLSAGMSICEAIKTPICKGN